MRRAITLVCALLLLADATQAYAETQWVTDALTVPLRSGPSNGHRIIHRGLPSGTALEIVEAGEQNGFTHVRMPTGTDGWIETQYLVNEPVAKDRLEAANRHVQALEKQLAERSKSVSDLTSQGQATSADREALAQQVAALEAELAEVKSISSGAIDAHEKATELADLNERLRSEVDELSAEVQQLEAAREQRNLWLGGGLVGAGLLAGVLLKARPRRSGWS